ncbi:MAG: hypothetical protein QGH99_01765 [Pseudomonadales bacterium]|nr:hypothetical protein [Pseudomonadales bacterium]MDP7575663.1 hypothetical protein [Pseudomonadales bacterium]HJP49566.1 hypothetical protein [Pseudomonadales bacterium]|tara:strand:- start:2224 stop:3876 length:1653 start_codon:yes stop_codon:yes gene_type:complete
MSARYSLTVCLLTLVGLMTGCSDKNEPKTQNDAKAYSEAAEQKKPVLTTLATGADIAGTNGLHFSPDGRLYVASVLGSDLTIIDPGTGEVLKKLSSAEGVAGPDDVAFSSDGSFFWTSILTGEVAGINAAGERIVAAQLGAGVNPIAFSDDDRLFVAQCFYGDKLFEVDPKGISEPRLISDQLGPGCGLNGMDWGPDDRLYGPRWFRGEIVSFNVDDNSMRLEASGFDVPAAVKFNSKGELHVLDTARGAVIKVDADKKTVVATLSQGLDNFAFDANDQIYVSSFADGFVKRVEDNGSLTTLLPGGMAHPGGITLHGGNLVVADLHAIRTFNLAGEEIGVQRNIFGSGEMGSTINISSDGQNLILTSWTDTSVRVWDPKAQKVVEKFDDLVGAVAALRYNGKVVIAEHGKNRVFAPGDGTVFAADLSAPTGLVIHGEDLFVSDYTDGVVLRIARNGIPLVEPETVVTGLSAPEGFVVDDKGYVVVESDIGQITRIGHDGVRTLLGKISPGSIAASEAQPPSMVFNGITQTSAGVYFLAVEKSRTLLKLAM